MGLDVLQFITITSLDHFKWKESGIIDKSRIPQLLLFHHLRFAFKYWGLDGIKCNHSFKRVLPKEHLRGVIYSCGLIRRFVFLYFSKCFRAVLCVLLPQSPGLKMASEPEI